MFFQFLFYAILPRLHSHCTIFCKRVNARAEMRHTNPLQCSDCKNILQSEHCKGLVWRISARTQRLCNVNAAPGVCEKKIWKAKFAAETSNFDCIFSKFTMINSGKKMDLW